MVTHYLKSEGERSIGFPKTKPEFFKLLLQQIKYENCQSNEIVYLFVVEFY